MQQPDPAEMDGSFVSDISGTKISSGKTKWPKGEKVALKSQSHADSHFRCKSIFHQIK